MKITASEHSLERFHYYDGIRYADGASFNVGDIVDVEEPLQGIDKNGSVYNLDASGFFTKNVVQLLTTIDSSGNVTVNDGTANSPIAIHNATDTSFSPANILNRMLFKPYTITTTVANKVIDTTGQVANTVVDTASNVVQSTGSFLSGLSKNLNWILLAVVVIGAIYLIRKFKFV